MWPRAAVQAHRRCRNVLGEPGVRSWAEEEELETNPGAQGLNPSIRVRSDPAFLFPQQRGFPGPHLSLLSHFLMTISGLFPPPSLHFHCFFFFFFSETLPMQPHPSRATSPAELPPNSGAAL